MARRSAKRKAKAAAAKAASGRWCTTEGKIRYRDEFSAMLALASTQSRGRDECNYYPCKACRGFHLTRNGKLPPSVERRQLKAMVKATARRLEQRRQHGEEEAKQAHAEQGRQGEPAA